MEHHVFGSEYAEDTVTSQWLNIDL